jgi:murein DD-endopeptidase MepM/ murein hydrolase activator NlpD
MLKSMLKKNPLLAKNPIDRFILHFSQFSAFFSIYLKRKIVIFSTHFEKNKNLLVKFFMMKRGRYSRPFLHVSAMGVLIIGVIASPLIGESYPIFSSENVTTASAQSPQESIIVGEDVFSTNVSQKPRDEIISYTVQKGDTLSTIARKFNVSVETIQWENDITGESITVGDELKILPVSGMSYEVSSGDTIYTIAKKLDTDPQKIVDFPFNDFANPETFSLTTGQTLIVPDAVKPSEQGTYVRPRQPVYAQTPSAVGGSGYAWPLSGGISQYASWYHMAIDITNSIGAPIVSATNGTVTSVIVGTWDGGYGNNVLVSDANGVVTRYAHMGNVYVSPGQAVSAGSSVIGTVGMTGRTTGPHLHFEVIVGGALVNPLSYLQ